MKKYYQGEDIPFSISFSAEFQNAKSFSEFSEIRAYAYTDGCLIQKFSTVNKPGYESIVLDKNILSGIIQSEYSSRFSSGAIIVETVGMKQNSELKYDIGKQIIGGLRKSFIKAEKLDGGIPVSLSLSKYNITFEESADSENISVTITGTENKSYSILNIPSWLTVSNQTESGFTLTADENPNDNSRSTDLTVQLDAYPATKATLNVTQSGAWLSQFIFDVVTTVPNETVETVINLGAVEEGDARIDYNDGSAIEIRTIPQSQEISFIDAATGNTKYTYVGESIPHTFLTAGTHTVNVKVRQGVNAVRFSTIAEGSTSDWAATYAPNPYIRAIHKIQSDSLESLNKLFAGCVRASFGADFLLTGLETPNVIDLPFIFENFGAKGVTGNGSMYNYTLDDNMRFPDTMYQHFTKKNQIINSTREYFGSVFEKITPNMLWFSAPNTLVSAIETFRQMPNVGGNWVAKYAPTQGSQLDAYQAGLEEFVDTAIFQQQSNISNFMGVLNSINDFYGNYGNGYGHKWLLNRDLFKNNNAVNINLEAAFNKATNAVLETNFFGATSISGVSFGQRIKSMPRCFWGMKNSIPKFAYNMFWMQYRGNRLDEHPDSLFPDHSYPNMESFLEAFAYIADGVHRTAYEGFHCLFQAPNAADGLASDTYNNPFTSTEPRFFTWNGSGWTITTETVQMDNLNVQQFLSRFPSVTASSGEDDSGNPIDGAAWNFGDWDGEDINSVKKAADFDTFSANNPARSIVMGVRSH